MEKSTRQVVPEKIYEMGDEKHGVAVLYKGSSDNYVYLDKECTTKVNDTDMLRMYAHGAVVLMSGVYHKPISYGNKTLTLADASKTTLKTV